MVRRRQPRLLWRFDGAGWASGDLAPEGAEHEAESRSAAQSHAQERTRINRALGR